MTLSPFNDSKTLLWHMRIVEEARKWVGTPYLHQASLQGAGCDCLGLVRGVWRSLYGSEPEPMPHYTADWGEAEGDELLWAAALRHFDAVRSETIEAGDLLLFRWRATVPAKHLGIATDAQTMIHAHAGACVAEVPFGLWGRKIVARFSFPEPVSA